MGFTCSDPSTPPPLRGSIPRIDYAPISANNELIFLQFSVVLWVSYDAESIYEKSPEVAMTDFRLRSTSDIKVKVIIMVAMYLVI